MMNEKLDGLPPLPAPDRTMWQHGKQVDHYSADQMRAYAKAALDALADEAEAELKKMIDAGLGQAPAQPVAWQAIGGSIWPHKSSEDDRPLYTTPR